MRFSQRNGYSLGIKIAQRESMDIDLRNGLWNVITVVLFGKFKGASGGYNYVEGSNLESIANKIWMFYFKLPLDKRPSQWNQYLEFVRAYFFEAKWYEVYDFLEYVVSEVISAIGGQLVIICNQLLIEENSAYRFVDSKVIEVTSEEEIEEVEQAIKSSIAFEGARTHLARAIELYADRHKPDLRNSMKESISAVESLAIELVGEKATLGPLLKKMEANKVLHPALKNAFSSLYGYTNDSDGIRHALTDKSLLSKADARFMLVSCSAFINYIIALYEGE